MGWAHDDSAQIKRLICYDQCVVPAEQKDVENLQNASKCDMVQMKQSDSECKTSSSFAFFLQVEFELTPSTAEVGAAQARAVGLNKVSASISQSCVPKSGVESE